MRKLFIAIGVLIAAAVAAQGTVQYIRPQSEYTFTAFPLRMAVVSKSDTVDMTYPGFVRANVDGVVTVLCAGDTATVTLTLIAGEVVPCVVKRVYSTGTDAITLHVSY